VNKGQEELFNKLIDNLHMVHQDLVGKIGNSNSLNNIISQIEELRLEMEAKIDEHEVVLAGNKHHNSKARKGS
jgi:hypothetical protein